METKRCSKCGEELPLTEFYSKGNGKLRAECKKCHNDYVKNKYKQRKSQIDEIKTQYRCQKCGEDRSYVLDFHHVGPIQKEKTVARMISNNRPMEKIEEEINKCIVLCANCHRAFHYFHEHEQITLDDFLNNENIR